MSQSELDPRNQEAITAALEGAWEKAVALNLELTEEFPEDLDILNRLGKAYSELGQVNKAKATFEKVLETDPYNPIATKNIERLSTLRGSVFKPKDQGVKPLNPDVFIEEPGKTETVEVHDLAMPKVLINLRVGDSVKLSQTKENVTVISDDDHRLGKLEPEIGKDISQAINLGSQFSAIIKAIKVGKDEKNSALTIFVRETTHSKKLAHPVFSFESNFTPFVREETLSYLKDEEPVQSETSDGIEEMPVEDIPVEDHNDQNHPEEEIHHPQIDPIEDEEDFSQQ